MVGREITPEATHEYTSLIERARDILVCLDFDGTLAHIVDDPADARIHPEAPAVLLSLARQVGGVAIVTGRPVAQVLALGGFGSLAEELVDEGRDLHVLGQYGHERWSARRPRIASPHAPEALTLFTRDLGLLLGDSPWDPWLEEKGLAIAVHTRRLRDPELAQAELTGPISELARRHGLRVELGRLVIEVRAPGADKGTAVRSLVEQLSPSGIIFAGDDLGDIEAFATLDELRSDDVPTLRVYSASPEQPLLDVMADVVVDGPDGVVTFLKQLDADVAEALATHR